MSTLNPYMYGNTDPGPNGPIAALQEQLLARGLKLPRYGADGNLGKETWSALEAFAEVDELDTDAPVPQQILQALQGPTHVVTPPEGHILIQGDPNDVHGMRRWIDIDTVVLHQTGMFMQDVPQRFSTMNAHIGILCNHPTSIVQTQDLRAYMYHANLLNKRAIGIELNGRFPGLVSDFKAGHHTAIGPSTLQIEDARATLQWLQAKLAHHGGELKYIVPHRVSNKTRRNDPGEVAWQEIGVWAQLELGLSAMRPGFTIGSGLPIPYEWDDRPQYAGYKY